MITYLSVLLANYNQEFLRAVWIVNISKWWQTGFYQNKQRMMLDKAFNKPDIFHYWMLSSQTSFLAWLTCTSAPKFPKALTGCRQSISGDNRLIAGCSNKHYTFYILHLRLEKQEESPWINAADVKQELFSTCCWCETADWLKIITWNL